MKLNRLNSKNIIIIGSYLFLVAIFFATGYMIGGKATDGRGAISTSTRESVITDTFTPVPSHDTELYRLILEDGELRLYCDGGGISRLISNEKISEDSFPVSDIASLKQGETFETLDDAIALMENFLS